MISVRNNGTNVEFEECTDIVYKNCPSLDLNNVQKKNCKKDHECTGLDEIFRCENGQCYNLTAIYSCQWESEGLSQVKFWVFLKKKIFLLKKIIHT